MSEYSAIINYAKSGACPACEMPLAGVAIGSG